MQTQLVETTRVMDFGPNDIPDQIQAELAALADQEEQGLWELGKTVAMMVKALEAKRVDVPKMQMYKAVAVHVRQPAEQVRMAYYLYCHVPAKIRGEHTQLGYNHWKQFVPICEAPGDWDLHLDAWLDYVERNGLKPTVDSARAYVKGTKGEDPNPALTRYRRVMGQVDKLESDKSIDSGIRSIFRNFKQQLRLYTESQPELVSWVPSARPEDVE